MASGTPKQPVPLMSAGFFQSRLSRSNSLAALLYSPRTMVVVGFAASMLVILLTHAYTFATSEDFGYEVGAVARSIVSGHGYGSPFGGLTGPTASVPPIYTYIVTAAFRVFGIDTHAAGIFLESLNCLFLSLVSVIVFRVATIIFDSSVGVWAGWAWTLGFSASALLGQVGPKFIWPYAALLDLPIWETALSTMLLSSILLVTLRLKTAERRLLWLGFGVLWGFAALCNPAVLSFLPASLGWLAYSRTKHRTAVAMPIALTISALAVVITPWLVRNYLVFREPVFIRSNFGAEFRFGNGPDTDGALYGGEDPSKGVGKLRYSSMGEIRWIRAQHDETMRFIRTNPRGFLVLTAKRVVYWWFGPPADSRRFPAVAGLRNIFWIYSSFLAIGGLITGWKYRAEGMFLLTALVICYPLIYYIVRFEPRYRYPIEPELMIASVVLLREVYADCRRRWSFPKC